MEKNVSDIIKDVRLRLDMNQEDAMMEGFADTDTLNLDEIIKSKILEGIRLVEQNAPLEMFESPQDGARTAVVQFEDREKWVGGVMTLPQNFMRLHSFKMSDWDYSVHDALDVTDDRYPMQHSKYGGVKGNPQMPLVFIKPGATGLVLEFYSCRDATASIQTFLYIPLTVYKDDAKTKVEVQTRLYDSCVYEIARLVAVTLAEDEAAGRMDTVANEFIASEDSAQVAQAE